VCSLKAFLVASCLDDALGPGNLKKEKLVKASRVFLFLVKLFFKMAEKMCILVL
jgi:hypothetical protein